jgi:hypothetical protein
MSAIENHVDWTAPSMPGGDRVRPSLNQPKPSAAAEKRSVLDTLLGKNNLAASDFSGNDPYNATGKHFRR